MSRSNIVIYWDASAVLSALFSDAHSSQAIARARSSAIHVLSSLAWTETLAVISRIEREHALTPELADTSRETLAKGPWRRVNIAPDWQRVDQLSRAWPLRGADLWHLAAAARLREDLPELRLLSFDTRLAAAARAEGLAYIQAR